MSGEEEINIGKKATQWLRHQGKWAWAFFCLLTANILGVVIFAFWPNEEPLKEVYKLQIPDQSAYTGFALRAAINDGWEVVEKKADVTFLERDRPAKLNDYWPHHLASKVD